MENPAKASTRHKLKDWLMESALICASILLAFWLDDWGEQRTIEQRTQIALCNVKEELSFNYKLLTEDYRPRHTGILTHIKSTISQLSDTDKPLELPKIDRSLYNQQLRFTAWELAIETGFFLHVDFKLAAKISEVYNLQETSYKMIGPRIIESIFSDSEGISKATLRSQKKLEMLMTEWLQQQHFLISNYEELLALKAIQTLRCPLSE